MYRSDGAYGQLAAIQRDAIENEKRHISIMQQQALSGAISNYAQLAGAGLCAAFFRGYSRAKSLQKQYDTKKLKETYRQYQEYNRDVFEIEEGPYLKFAPDWMK